MSVDVLTFGCRLNGAESDAMRQHAAAAGLDDLVVVNTCAVTGEATRQARKAIRRTARERPGARIVVTGCAAQMEPELFAAMDEVGAVLGNDEKVRAKTWTDLRDDPDGPRVQVGDIMTARATSAAASAREAGRTRAVLAVQNGCDHRCTFCVIPYGRGNSRSVPLEDVVERARVLAQEGAREIVLTGVDLTSYGADLPDGSTLGLLVKAILGAVPDLPRLRLSSIDSVEADDDLLDAIATEARLMPHLHLSLQAGDDLVLKRMKRRHARADAIGFCRQVRRLRPDVVFGADLIAGFPTETDAMFGRSLDLIEECGLTHLHVFPYSPRPGTPAARMPAVPLDIVKARSERLRDAGSAALVRHLEQQVGAMRSVLVEAGAVGRTEGFVPVRLPASARRGEIVDVAISGHDGRHLLAA